MRYVLSVAFGLFNVLAHVGDQAEHPAFATKPSVKVTGGASHIHFAVKRPTEVEVAVLDSQGVVIRHLAAGLLGKNAPFPLKKDALTQHLIWDGNDDAGKPVKSGPLKVRIRLGLKPVFSHFIADAPGRNGRVLGQAA